MGKSEMICDCEVIHEEVVSRVSEGLPGESKITDIVEFFKVFGDSTRFKILYALDISEMCVCDIAVLLNMTKSAISHQLKVLRTNNLVKSKRAGKVVYYSLADHHVKEIIEKAAEHLDE